MSELHLRAWQNEFVKELLHRRRRDFLLIAAPAAGKTIAAAAAAALAMQKRACDQLVVVCPTVVVKDQWLSELERLGFRMADGFDQDVWPAWVHGVCATYAQVARRVERFRRGVGERPTVSVFDEIHRAGEDLAWGRALRQGFEDAELRLSLSGTPFRSDREHIPFVRYDPDGKSIADFAYDYATAVSDGVCRPISFHAHDGQITWKAQGGGVRSASFEDKLSPEQQARRLRAALHPDQPFMRAMLEAASRDLERLRRHIPDAAGLVVCDSQAHACALDPVLSEISGELPVIAMSDLPRSHEAIRHFARSKDRWLVSVRMVSEGVDIPRLGVIVWATAASTELMVRQVAGRALRGRAAYANLAAVMHIPADPRLCAHARRLDVLAGSVAQVRSGGGRGSRMTVAHYPTHSARSLDPEPFLKWFDRLAAGVGAEEVCRRCGWSYGAGMRKLYRWRNEGAFAHALDVYDACHMAGISFDALYDGDEYAAARAYVADPGFRGAEALRLGTVEAHAETERVLAPPLPPTKAQPPERLVVLQAPQLPPSPFDQKRLEFDRREQKGEVLKLLATYVALRRMVDPSFGLPAAHAELHADVGRLGTDPSDRQVSEALGWLKDRLALFAREHPDEVRELAQLRRRQAVSAG